MAKARDQSGTLTTYTRNDILDPNSNIRGSLLTHDERQSFIEEGKGYCLVNPAKQTALAMGGVSYSDTAPALLVDVPSGHKMLPLFLRLRQGGTVAGGVITVILTVDNIVRYTSGGTGITPLPLRTNVAAASSNMVAYYGTAAGAITAIAVSRNQLVAAAIITHDVATTPNSPQTRFNFPDGPDDEWPVLVGPASFVMYGYAATTQPSWFFNFSWLELTSSQ